MNFEQIKQKFEQFVIPNYTRNPVAFVRGEGSYVWDSEGNRYVDLMPGWGTTTIGHCHPRVVEAIRSQCAELIHVRTLQYEGIWVESLSLAEPDRQVARALFRAAIESAKRHPGVDRVGYLAPPENRLAYEACVGEGFSQVDEYLTFVREVSSR